MMTMNKKNAPNPWANIESPLSAGEVFARRERHTSKRDFFWIVDHRGRCGIRFLFSNISDLPSMPSLHEIDILFVKIGDGSQALDLFLENQSIQSVFLTICVDLMDSADAVKSDDMSVLTTILDRINDWQRLLKMTRQDTMPKSMQMGLWGELLVLRDIFMQHIPVDIAVQAWAGPTGGEQDFSLLGVTLVEVKTQSAASDRAVRINSADQLDDRSGNLYLAHQTITAAEEGLTLQGHVNAVRQSINNDISAYGRFERNLLEYGFTDHEEYDKEPYSLVRRTIYHVSDDFPRITREKISAEITDVRYRVDISLCGSFIVGEDVLIERVTRYDSE